jgi:hypothetical protein
MMPHRRLAIPPTTKCLWYRVIAILSWIATETKILQRVVYSLGKTVVHKGEAGAGYAIRAIYGGVVAADDTAWASELIGSVGPALAGWAARFEGVGV